MFADLLVKVGNVNYTSLEDLKALQQEVDEAVYVYANHNADESSYWASLIKGKDPAVLDKWLDDHKEHESTLRGFSTQMIAILDEQDLKSRGKLAQKLYESVCTYLSGDLAHMDFEEHTIMDIFYKHFTDEQLRNFEIEFVRTADPQFIQRSLPFIFKGHNIDGRTAVVKLIKRSGAPPEAVEATFAAIAKHATPEEVAEIRRRVEH